LGLRFDVGYISLEPYFSVCAVVELCSSMDVALDTVVPL